MEYQTRDHDGECRVFPSFKEAIEYAESNPDVWKVSFTTPEGDRIRLVETSDGWTYDPIVIEER